MEIEFTQRALDDLAYWKKTNNKLINNKIAMLFESILKDYKTGIGKPEYLRHLKYWSRRINSEHRLTYRVENDTIYIFSLKGHYTSK